MVAFLAPVASGVLALLIWCAASLASFVLGFSRFVLVRIVEYQKGAVQAILLCATILLGLITAYLKFINV